MELHLHLEGAITATRASALWARAKGVPPPPAGGLTPAGWRFSTLPEFLKLFGWMTRLLDGPQVYGEVLEDLLGALERQNVVYAEAFVSVGQMLLAGIDPARVLPHLAAVAGARARVGGPDVRFIADATRQLGPAAAQRVVDVARELAGDCRIVGFGMGGDERALPAADFRGVFDRAREARLGVTCHAGEGTSPQAVREAHEELRVTRIGHGISAIEDPKLVADLVCRDVVLEVCPTSNLRTAAWDPAQRGGPHPLLRLARAGVRIALGSDDPAFFESSLLGERAVAVEWGATTAELARWQRTAVDSAFLPEKEKAMLMRRVGAGVATKP